MTSYESCLTDTFADNARPTSHPSPSRVDSHTKSAIGRPLFSLGHKAIRYACLANA